MEEKTASNSKKTDSVVSLAKPLESKRKRKLNSFIYGKEYDCSTSEIQARGADETLSQVRPHSG